VLGDVFLHLRRDETPDALPAPNLLPNGARRDIQGRQGGAVQPSSSREAVAFPCPTIAMRFLFFNMQPRGGRGRQGRPGTGEEKEVARGKELLVPVPGGNLPEGVRPHHEHPVDPGLRPAEFLNRRQRVRGPFAADLRVGYPESPETAADAMANRCCASETGCLGLWGGWWEGRSTILGRPSVSRTSIAMRRWPLWNGSNVPPNRAADIRMAPN